MKKEDSKLNFKKTIVDAIKLYKELYFEAFSLATSGELISKAKQTKAEDFLKGLTKEIESVESKAKTITDNFKTPSGAVQKKMLSLKAFLPALTSSVESLKTNDLAQNTQNFLTGISEGLDSDAEVDATLKLMSLIHGEFTKKHSSSKKTAVSEEEIVSQIITKAVKNEGLYSHANLSANSKSRECLDSMLGALESQKYIKSLQDFYLLYSNAYDAITEIQNAYLEDANLRDYISNQITNETGIKVSISVDEEKSKTTVQETGKSLLKILESPHHSPQEKSEMVALYRKEVMSSFRKTEQSVLNVEKLFTRVADSLEKYDERYNAYYERLEEDIKEIKAKRGFEESDGIVEGLVTGTTCNKFQNAETGEWEIGEVKGEERDISDFDIIATLYNRSIVHASSIQSYYNGQFEKNGSLESVERILGDYVVAIESADKTLEGDYQKVLECYNNLLLYKQQMLSFPFQNKRALAGYIRNFNPKFQGTNISYFNEEQLRRIREYGRKACIESMDFQKIYYDTMAPTFAYGVLNVINEMPLRSELKTGIDNYANADKIMREAVGYNMKGEDCSLLDIIQQETQANRVLESPQTATADVKHLLKNDMLEARLNGLVPLLGVEIGYSSLETLKSIVLGNESDAKKKQYETKLLALEDFMKQTNVKQQAYFQSEAFYRFLVNRIAYIKQYTEENQRQIRAMIFAEYNRRRITDFRLERLNNTFESYYAGWLNNLHIAERNREEKGLPILTEGRDLKKEKELIERYNAFIAEHSKKVSGEDD